MDQADAAATDRDAGPAPAPFAERLERLAALPAAPGPRQKVFDARDLADPRIDFVIRHCLGRTPQIKPRLWEAARIYDLLAQAGALRADARGLSFGSGREVVLYAIANSCARLTATDLYTADTSWGNARTADAAAYVLTNPPMPVDAARLSVRSMDARSIGFPDAGFDFAYSVSSFEHFGDDDDFIAHLSEVRRVLRPGGVYVFTTEVRFAMETRRTRGNYAFALPHLLDLFDSAGMRAEPAIDMRQADWAENEPRPPAGVLAFGMAAQLNESFAVRDFSGDISAAVCFVLRPGKGPRPRIIGLEGAIGRQEARRRRATARRFLDWTPINPFGFAASGRSPFCDLFVEPRAPQPDSGTVFATTYVCVGEGPAEARVTLVDSTAGVSDGEVAVVLMRRARDGDAFTPVARERVRFAPGEKAARQITFAFDATDDASYAIQGSKPAGSGPVMLGAIEVLLRRARG